jgi:pyruvate dehydrogenase E2 component (dihydrolipoamide acetyltransferase)
MLHKITMPAAGQTTDQLRILKWNKAKGDTIQRGDVLLEIETDKATLEVESFAKGTLLKILVDEGETASTGDVVAYIGEQGELALLEDNESPKTESRIEVSAAEDEYQPIMPSAPVQPQQVSFAAAQGEYKASPAAKKAARDLNVELSELYKKNSKVMIKEKDVQDYAASANKNIPEASDANFELVPLSSMRRVIATRMSQSALTVPAYFVETEVDMSACMALRSAINSLEEGIRVSYNDILAKCVAAAAKNHPYVNASYEEENIRIFKKVNIGFAVSIENGLIVPVVRDVGAKGLRQIAAENTVNITKARTGKITPADLEGGTFTISNMGMYPVTRFTAIINPPQSCILALGSIVHRPVWFGDQFIAKPMMSITATFDHRIVDGAYGAAFLKDLKELMENPSMLLL